MSLSLIEDLTEAAQNSIAQQDTKLAAVCIITIIDLIRQDELRFGVDIRTGRVQEQDRQRAIKQIMRCLTPQVTPDKEVATLIMGGCGDLQHSKGSYRSIVRRNKPQEVVFVAYGEDQAQADAFAALVIKGVIDMR